MMHATPLEPLELFHTALTSCEAPSSGISHSEVNTASPRLNQGRLLRQALNHHVLLCDGAMGSQVQALPLEVTADFWECENCTEVLNLSRPDVVKGIHRAYLVAGADMVQTNSFGGSEITLGEFNLQAKTFEINETAARLARETIIELQAAQEIEPQDLRPRFVLGSIGPGTKLPSLGHIDYTALEASFFTQARGLLSGGIDGFLIETCQDPLQIKAAIQGTKRAKASNTQFQDVPILVQVTVETTGTLLVGSDISAVVTILESLDIDSLGLNCATGPAEMREHIQYLSQHWPHWISVQPNAGLPCLLQGKTHYPLTPEEMVTHVQRFITQNGVNLIGGCCGTTPAHIEALHTMLS
ncbi:MAG: homocysteine S-methyltransferase family protein, partial [Vampirovibrionales bacterium]